MTFQMPASNKACHIMLFADDTNLFLKGTDLLSLKRETEQALVELSTWFAQNKLTMSLEKTQYSIFHAKNKKIAMGFNTMNIYAILKLKG